MKVVVVGAGIIGASISVSLARAGCKVTILDGAPAAATAATGKSWAWINANKKYPKSYRDLNLAGLNMWRDDPQWSSLLPPPGPTRCAGALLVGAAADTSNSVAMDPSYPYTIVDASQLQQLEPGLAPGVAAGGGQLYLQETWVDPIAATASLLDTACSLGAQLHLDTHALELLVEEVEEGAGVARGQLDAAARLGRHQAAAAGSSSSSSRARRVTGVVATTSNAPVAASPQQQQQQPGRQPAHTVYGCDTVVVAGGVGSARLLATAGVDLHLLHKPAHIATTAPLAAATAAGEPPEPAGQQRQRRVLRHMVYDGNVWVWQRPDGSCIIGDAQGSEDATVTVSAAKGRQLLQAAAQLVPALAHADMHSVEVGLRPWPQDGHPVVGSAPGLRGLYMAVMHSGITLAPIIGKLAAQEVLAAGAGAGSGAEGVVLNDGVRGHGHDGGDDGDADSMLAPFRPGRDMTSAGAGAGGGGVTQAYGWGR